MIKNANKNTKCATVHISDDYEVLSDNLSNPYCYNFGRKEKNASSNAFSKLHHKTNVEYITKK